MTDTEPQKIAVWLINEIKNSGKIKRAEAVSEIEATFGSEYIRHTPKGNKTLHESVLKNLRELKDNSISWNVGQQAWIANKHGRPTTANEDAAEQLPPLPTAVEPREVPPNATLEHPALYLNRELGWLDFNWRVLHQAMDPRTPLLERVRFIAITASNLDEFVQKRIGGLKRQEAAGVYDLSPDGRTPDTQIDLVQQKADHMLQKISEVWEQNLRPQIADEASIKISNYSTLKAEQRQQLNDYFDDHIYPTLTPLAVDPGHPFPFISNLSLSLAVKLTHPRQDRSNFARVKIPTNQPRWLPVNS
ncbi:MAG: hypothetical protein U5J63_11465 [Fodinibius sp.]|nr:hypothetical protein [Fodinibius sp.]